MVLSEPVEAAIRKLGEVYRFRRRTLARQGRAAHQVSSDELVRALELACVALRLQPLELGELELEAELEAGREVMLGPPLAGPAGH